MPSRPREFHLAIIGGCMSHQHDVPLNSLYQRRIAAWLAADDGIVLRPHIVRDFELDLATRLARIPADQPVDGVLAHVRAANMVAPAHLLRRWTVGGSLVLNPALFRRGPAQTAALSLRANQVARRRKPRGPDAYGDSPNSQDSPPAGIRIAGHRLRDMNLALGSVVGLDDWAIDQELRRFDCFVAECQTRGLPFFAVGPAPVEYSYWTRRIVHKANARMRATYGPKGVPMVLIEARSVDGRPISRADGIHLTVDGQRFVAEQLYAKGMHDWIRSIVATWPESDRPAAMRHFALVRGG